MIPRYEPVIGLEVHAELQTRTKMFCGCPVVDTTRAEPNTSVCEVCLGLPGTLPTLNQRAVELGLRVALALGSAIPATSRFARKNYFYPDLPKGFQISQYETPLAEGGSLSVPVGESAERRVRIRRVHLEEDTGKLLHAADGSLVDYNRSGVPLLEIVTEPDLHSVDEAKAFAAELRSLLRALQVTSGDMEKGAIRFEANVSLRAVGDDGLGPRTEIKNLNSFRAMARAVAFEIERQGRRLAAGQPVEQETRGWDDDAGRTLPQRDKEEAHDYRYFPEPDLPPLHVDPAWVERLRRGLPELPEARRRRWQREHGLDLRLAARLSEDPAVADYYDAAVAAAPAVPPAKIAHWLTVDLFGLLNAAGLAIDACRVEPAALAELVALVDAEAISPPTGKHLLARLFRDGGRPAPIVEAEGLGQVSDFAALERLVADVVRENPEQVRQYRGGKKAVAQWLVGQVMRRAGGRAKPSLVQDRLLAALEAGEQTPPGG